MRRNFIADGETEFFLSAIHRLNGKSISDIIRESIIDAGNRILIPAELEDYRLPYFTLNWPARMPRRSRDEIRSLDLAEKKKLARRIVQYRDNRNPYLLKCVICNSPPKGFDEIHFHHEDYDFPDRITPLCRPHHAQRHKFLREKIEQSPLSTEVMQEEVAEIVTEIPTDLDEKIVAQTPPYSEGIQRDPEKKMSLSEEILALMGGEE